jgi:hypothetical protein
MWHSLCTMWLAGPSFGEWNPCSCSVNIKVDFRKNVMWSCGLDAAMAEHLLFSDVQLVILLCRCDLLIVTVYQVTLPFDSFWIYRWSHTVFSTFSHIIILFLFIAINYSALLHFAWRVERLISVVYTCFQDRFLNSLYYLTGLDLHVLCAYLVLWCCKANGTTTITLHRLRD